MRTKEPFSDYEPLKRLDPKAGVDSVSESEADPFSRTSSKSSSDDDDWKSLTKLKSDRAGDSRNQTEPDSTIQLNVDRIAIPDEVKSDSANADPPIRRENWILKNGHGISFWGTVLFTALVFFRPYEWSPSLMWLSTSAFWVAIATVAIFLPTQLGLENTLTARPREVTFALLLLFFGLLSIPLSLDHGKAFSGLIDFFKVILIFVVMVNVIRTEQRLKTMWFVVLAASCFLSVGALNDYRAGRLELMGMRIQGVIGGLFDNPNDLALHLVTMIPIALALMLGSKNIFYKIILLGCVILLLGGVVVTFSRAGFLGLVCALGVFVWKAAKKSRVPVLIAASLGLVIFVIAAPGGYRNRVSTTGDDSALARFDDLKRSIYIASRHPLTGVGMDNYILYSNFNKASHNAYTQVASELGVAAAIIYILFIIQPIRRLRQLEADSRTDKQRKRLYYLSIGLQASLFGYMVSSFFASVAFVWYIYYLVAYSIALRRIYYVSAVQEEKANSVVGTTDPLLLTSR